MLACLLPSRLWSSSSSRRYSRTRHALDAPRASCLPCDDGNGEIVVTPPPGAQLPVRAYWSGHASSDPIRQSADSLRATHLSAGEYSVHVVDARGICSGVTSVTVESTRVPTVCRYETSDASGDDAEDGEVTAVCAHVPSNSHFAWSNGARTRGPTLSHVPPGRYLAWIVPDDEERASSCRHISPSACVRVRGEGGSASAMR